MEKLVRAHDLLEASNGRGEKKGVFVPQRIYRSNPIRAMTFMILH